MSDIEIKVPNIGDFKDVEVIEVLVKKGQSIKKNDPLITIESDKSSVEIPSSFEGKISNLNIKVGDKVSEGDLILTLEKLAEINQKDGQLPCSSTLFYPFQSEIHRKATNRKVIQFFVQAILLDSLSLVC